MPNTKRLERRARARHLLDILEPKQGYLHVCRSSLSFLVSSRSVPPRSIKIGILSQKPAQLLANLEMALPAVAMHIQGGWDNIQALHIKTNSSASLPIWNCKLDDSEGGRWSGLAAAQDSAGEVSESELGNEGEEQVVGAKIKQAVQVNGKKRSQDEGEEVENPKKKAKGLEGRVVEAAITATSKNICKTQTRDPPSKPNKHASAIVDASKPKKHTSESLPSSAAPQTSRNIADTASSSKEKKTKKNSTALTKSIAPAVEHIAESRSAADPSTGVTGTKDHKKMKIRVSTGAAVPDAPRNLKVNKDLVVKTKEAPSSSGGRASPEKPPKEKTDVLPAMTAGTERSSLTKDQLRHKRSGDPGEKKKKKVRLVGVKSVKNDALGKKIAQ